MKSMYTTAAPDLKANTAKWFDLLDRQSGDFASLRKQARSRFRELELPTARTEDWRFTNLASLQKESFSLAEKDAVQAEQLPPLAAPEAFRLTFVNGWFAPGLSRLGALPTGVALGSLAHHSADALSTHLNRIADAQEHAFTALNTSLLADGAYLIVDANKVLEAPLEILFVTKPGAKKPVTSPRLLIVLGANAQATVVERYLSLGAADESYFTNAVTEIALAESALLDHVKLQQESPSAYHIANTQIALAAKTHFTTNYIGFGGGLVRNEVRLRFDGQHAHAVVNGLYAGRGTQHLDNHTVIDHAQPNCQSHQVYKGILDDQAHGVYNGKIFVRQDAQKTDAKQTNKVLLLSDQATINTKPQLEIFADDVKCTHGATVGQLDDAQMYYLQTRGIPKDEAERILTYAFANDLVLRIKLQAIRDQMESCLMR